MPYKLFYVEEGKYYSTNYGMNKSLLFQEYNPSQENLPAFDSPILAFGDLESLQKFVAWELIPIPYRRKKNKVFEVWEVAGEISDLPPRLISAGDLKKRDSKKLIKSGILKIIEENLGTYYTRPIPEGTVGMKSLKFISKVETVIY